MPDSASRTSSSLNGLMMAVTSFIAIPCLCQRCGTEAPSAPRRPSERLADREHEPEGPDVANRACAVHRVPVFLVGIGADKIRAEQPASQVVRHPDLVVEIVHRAVV